MAKSWVITLEPKDKSAPVRVVETLNNRKKIAEVETYLCMIFSELMPSFTGDPAGYIKRVSGTVTMLDKAPYVLSATLSENHSGNPKSE